MSLTEEPDYKPMPLITPPVGRSMSGARPTAEEGASAELAARVEAKDLCFYYGDFQALKNISISLYEKKITALIGPSGCGKSTFLRTLNRMNDLVEGTRIQGQVLLDGIDINGSNVDPAELRKRVGMVFQRPNPFSMSIFDNIAYGPRIHGRARKKDLESLVEECLTQAALWNEVKDKLKQSALALSGGQQQRLCIARVLATRPEVVLMDEPCSALDPNSTYRIEELMEQLKNDYTIIIVTHNMQQAARVSDNTGYFLRGELIEFGPTDRIFTTPINKETEDYIRGRFG
jgi:phosphate transport system ATP-binding protein